MYTIKATYPLLCIKRPRVVLTLSKSEFRVILYAGYVNRIRQ